MKCSVCGRGHAGNTPICRTCTEGMKAIARGKREMRARTAQRRARVRAARGQRLMDRAAPRFAL